MRRYTKPACLLTIAVCLFSSGYLLAEEKEPKATPAEQLRADLGLAEAQSVLHSMSDQMEDKSRDPGPDANDRMARLYSKAAANPELSSAARTYVIGHYYNLWAKAKSTQQAQQAGNDASVRLLLLQTAQNEQIIQLLKQLAAKK